MQQRAAFAHRPADDALQVGKRETRRNVADLLDPGGFERGAASGGEPRQFVDAVFGACEAAGAMRVVRASVRVEAVIARPDLGRRRAGPGEHRQHRARPVEDRVQPEQRVEVEPRAIVDIAAVEGEHAGLTHVEPGALQHPQLDGDVAQEDAREPGGRFRFRRPPAAARQALNHVDPASTLSCSKHEEHGQRYLKFLHLA